jgi:hypothetical protein
MRRSAFPHTLAAVAASASVRATHVLALASPNEELQAHAQQRRDALLAKEREKDAKNKGGEAELLVLGTAWRATVRAAEAHPDVKAARATLVTCADPLEREHACAQLNAAFSGNAAVLQAMRTAAAATAQARGCASWADMRAQGLGGVARVRETLRAYATSLQGAVAVNEATLRGALGVCDDDLLAWWDRARGARLCAASTSAAPVPTPGSAPGSAPEPAASAHVPAETAPPATDAMGTLRAWLHELSDVWRRVFYACIVDVECVDEGVGAWAVPLVRVRVEHAGAQGEIWIDALARPTKPPRGVTARIFTGRRAARADAGTDAGTDATANKDDEMGAALVLLPFAADASAWGAAERATFAHEMGHGLHQSLSKTDEDALPFCEVPSTLSEYAFVSSVGWTKPELLGGLCQVYDACVSLWALEAFATPPETPAPRLSAFLREFLPRWRIPEDAGEHAVAAIASKLDAYYSYVLSDLVADAVLECLLGTTSTPDEQDDIRGQLWAYMTDEVPLRMPLRMPHRI